MWSKPIKCADPLSHNYLLLKMGSQEIIKDGHRFVFRSCYKEKKEEEKKRRGKD